MPEQSAVIFANGEMPAYDWARGWFSLDDTIVAVDGGLNHCLALGITPYLLLGDLDSVTPAQAADMAARGVRIEKYPAEKDETDLELALLWAARKGFSRIHIFAALGGRIDQTVANLSLLLLPELANIDVRILDKTNEIFLIAHESTITGYPGDIVSLLPWGGSALGVATRNLQYPLHEAVLTPDRSRGVSNVMLGESASVSLEEGSLLCIHSHPWRFAPE